MLVTREKLIRIYLMSHFLYLDIYKLVTSQCANQWITLLANNVCLLHTCVIRGPILLSMDCRWIPRIYWNTIVNGQVYTVMEVDKYDVYFV